MKRNCRESKSGMKHRGQDVLPGVLLHMIETALPINRSLHQTNCDRLVDNVDHFIFFVENVPHTRVSKPSRIMRLTAGGGIKCSAIQLYARQRSWLRAFRIFRCGGAFWLATQYLGGKFPRERIVVIKPFGRHFICCCPLREFTKNGEAENISTG